MLDKARNRIFASIKANADRHAAKVLPIIREVKKSGARTARGGQWHATSVKNVLERAVT
jgi:hypothetical protein